MTKPALSRPARHLPIAVAFAFGALTGPALAQGTAEQREACTEDAVRLCPDTIPDVDRTTACMKRHEAQLSRRCQRVVSAEDATPPGTDRRRRRLDRAAPRPDDDDDQPRRVERQAPPPDDYDEPRRAERVAPPAYGYDYDAPRRVDRFAPPPDDYDEPRRVERVAPPYDDGFGPKRYLYLTPRGTPAETPDDER